MTRLYQLTRVRTIGPNLLTGATPGRSMLPGGDGGAWLPGIGEGNRDAINISGPSQAGPRKCFVRLDSYS